MSILKLFIAILLFLTTHTAIMQQDDKQSNESQQQENNEAVKNEEKEVTKTISITEVWKLHAIAVCSRFNIDEEMRDSVIEIYQEVRANQAERVRQLRAMEDEKREDRIRRSRQSGTYIVSSIDEMIFLQRSIHKASEDARTKLADKLVEILERDVAELVYPPLAAFDKKVDALIKVIAEQELDEEQTRSAIDSIDIYYAESIKAREKMKKDRKAWAIDTQVARKKLIKALTPMLSEENIKAVSRMIGIKTAPKKKRGG